MALNEMKSEYQNTNFDAMMVCINSHSLFSLPFHYQPTEGSNIYMNRTAMNVQIVSPPPYKPSAAVLPAFFAAPAMPFLRRNSSAAWTSLLLSASAFLQSIIPAPVLSRSSLTALALTATYAYAKEILNAKERILSMQTPKLTHMNEEIKERMCSI